TNYRVQVSALRASSGQVVWGPIPIATHYYEAGLAYENGRLFILSFDGVLQALSANDGQLLWSVLVADLSGFSSQPTAAGGLVFVSPGGDNRIHAFDQVTGAERWSASFNHNDGAPSYSGGSVYVAEACANTVKLNATSGALAWGFTGNCSGGG